MLQNNDTRNSDIKVQVNNIECDGRKTIQDKTSDNLFNRENSASPSLAKHPPLESRLNVILETKPRKFSLEKPRKRDFKRKNTNLTSLLSVHKSMYYLSIKFKSKFLSFSTFHINYLIFSNFISLSKS